MGKRRRPELTIAISYLSLVFVPFPIPDSRPMKFWSVLGNSQKLDGGAMFGNAPRAMWTKWLAPDEENRVPLACRALLVEGVAPDASHPDGKRVLFETGIGAFFEPKLRERYGVV